MQKNPNATTQRLMCCSRRKCYDEKSYTHYLEILPPVLAFQSRGRHFKLLCTSLQCICTTGKAVMLRY